MTAAPVTPHKSEADAHRLVVRSLRTKHFAIVPAALMHNWLQCNEADILEFQGFWDNLTLDRFMGDGGVYRFRRYDALALTLPGKPKLLPHAPYEQPTYINHLNGGVARHFDPLESDFVQHPLFTRLLCVLAGALDEVEEATQHWDIRIHPYRIRADLGQAGLPTPEGLHRDGVDYIVIIMMDRFNVVGGESVVTDLQQNVLHRKCLQQPLEMLIADDQRVMHAATPVVPIAADNPAYRDVLVVAFTKTL